MSTTQGTWTPDTALAAARAAMAAADALPPSSTLWEAFSEDDKVCAAQSVSTILTDHMRAIRDVADEGWQASQVYELLRSFRVEYVLLPQSHRRCLFNAIELLGTLGATYTEMCNAVGLCPKTVWKLCTRYGDLRSVVIAASIAAPAYWITMRNDMRRNVASGKSEACILLFSDPFTTWREALVREDYASFVYHMRQREKP